MRGGRRATLLGANTGTRACPQDPHMGVRATRDIRAGMPNFETTAGGMVTLAAGGRCLLKFYWSHPH